MAREALSARIDGEREPVPAARVDEHLDAGDRRRARLERRGATSGERKGEARSGERRRGGAPDARARTGDEGDARRLCHAGRRPP